MERSILLLATAFVVILYEAILLFTPLLAPYRFPIPYAVPIFDSPFALMAIGVAYLCLERHRLRQDAQSAVLGMTLWVAGLLALAHIFAQPDYPRSEEHTSELQSRPHLVCRLLLEKKKIITSVCQSLCLLKAR